MSKKVIFIVGLCCALVSLSSFAEQVSYDIFLIPQQKVAEQISSINHKLAPFHLSTLSQQGYLSHITLYLTEYDSHQLPQIKQNVEKLAAHWQPFAVNLTTLEQTKSDWLMWSVGWSSPLQRLSDEVVMGMSPLRAKAPLLPSWVAQYPDKLAAFQRYGSPNVFANFDPHITLLAQSDHQKLTAFLQKEGHYFNNITIEAEGIGIAQVNRDGQSKHPIATYYFHH